MSDIRLKALVLSVLTISILFLITDYYVQKELDNIQEINLKSLTEDNIICTGDIILFRYTCMDLTFRIFSKYTHVGLIIRYNGKIYILECHPNEKCECKNNQGVHFYSLEKKLKSYNGSLYFCKMNLNQKQRTRIKNVIFKNKNNYKKIKFEFDSFIMFISGLLNKKYPVKDSYMYCSQFVMKIFYDANIYKNITNLPIVPDIFLLYKQNFPLVKIVI